ncbi:response regulator [Bacteroides xylanisolvens]|uniref:Response regulator n=2 Tax=Bacteroides xylanisolvens TaxID=371601 RepID=A0A1Y4UYB0_9BACE|nr:response regulator receiver domain protein [Bacteroides sp. 2_2_4]KAB6149677.1 response regulator [Bacteroides xylanisolvens]RGD50351.1 response regulator [Bacteroides sp. AM16-13]MBV3841955.1 response regulator [Bacteroides xylanisolvens]OUQ62732.1 response regulator [Bacteroides xylanisolvens]
MLMEPAINLYSPNEKSELIRENYQEILSVLAAHQIALWEYDIITGKCSFSELGQEAINSFIRESPDLILMDIRMPVMDGIQATEKIRTISLTVPIIAVTAYAFYTEQQQAIQAGCNAVISKPYSLERLRETIESYIG